MNRGHRINASYQNSQECSCLHSWPGLRISSLNWEQFDVRIGESEAGLATHPCRDPCCIFKGLRTVGILDFR